jgi:beta-lactamase class D
MKLLALVLTIVAVPTLLAVTSSRDHHPLRPYFEGLDGTFVLLDEHGATVDVYNSRLARQPLTPCSTFKILNTIIGLETGVISDKSFSLRFDPDLRDKNKTGIWPRSWSRDHNLKSAFKNSVLWYYQEIARRVGSENMNRYVAAANYGNKKVGSSIDRFWLTGSLKISPFEQARFVKDLFNNQLPFKEENVKMVKDMTVMEEDLRGTVLRGKTGTCVNGQKIGSWLVGEIEQSHHKFYYAFYVVGSDFSTMYVKRPKMLKNILASKGLWVEKIQH